MSVPEGNENVGEQPETQVYVRRTAEQILFQSKLKYWQDKKPRNPRAKWTRRKKEPYRPKKIKVQRSVEALGRISLFSLRAKGKGSKRHTHTYTYTSTQRPPSEKLGRPVRGLYLKSIARSVQVNALLLSRQAKAYSKSLGIQELCARAYIYIVNAYVYRYIYIRTRAGARKKTTGRRLWEDIARLVYRERASESACEMERHRLLLKLRLFECNVARDFGDLDTKDGNSMEPRVWVPRHHPWGRILRARERERERERKRNVTLSL